jgi:hypothetical protein
MWVAKRASDMAWSLASCLQVGYQGCSVLLQLIALGHFQYKKLPSQHLCVGRLAWTHRYKLLLSGQIGFLSSLGESWIDRGFIYLFNLVMDCGGRCAQVRGFSVLVAIGKPVIHYAILL